MNHFIFRSLGTIFMAGIIFGCHSADKTKSAYNSDLNSLITADIKPDTPFYVESMTPQGQVSSSVKYPSVQILFSEPVVPLEKLGEPTSKSDAITITPPLKGTFRWYGTSLLSFDCEESLIPQKQYIVHINSDLKSVAGNKISGQLVYAFNTDPIRLLQAFPLENYESKNNNSKRLHISSNDIPPEYAQDIVLSFSNKVNSAVISKYIYVHSSPDNSKKKNEIIDYQFTCKALDENTLHLHLKQPVEKNSVLTVGIKAGAMPDKDCVQTKEDSYSTLHTLRPIEFKTLEGETSLTFYFNHKIKSGTEKQILEGLSFKPAMNLSAEQILITGNSVCVKDLPVSFKDSYTVTLAADSVCDIYGQTYGKAISKKIEVPDAESFARFNDPNFIILESQFEPKRAIEFQNIDKNCFYQIEPISGVTDGYKAAKAKKFDVKTTKETKNKKVIQTIELAPFLESTAEGYRGALQLTVRIPNEWSKNKYYEHTKYVQVTDLGVDIRNAWNETAVLVSSLSTGLAVKNAEVSIFEIPDTERNAELRNKDMLLGKGTKIAGAKTDKEGLAILNFKTSQQWNYQFMEVRTENDRVVIPFGSGIYHPVKLQDGNLFVVDAQGNKKQADYSTFDNGRQITRIFSDTNLYRPGETVRFKIIDKTLSLGTYSTYTGDWEVNFYGNNYWSQDSKPYATFKGTASKEGSSSVEWKIPEDFKPGSYFIEYKRTSAQHHSEYQEFNVQFFEKLRFQANAAITPVTYTTGDQLTATVTASYLGGGTLSGGNVYAEWTRDRISFAPNGKQYADYCFGPLFRDWYWRESDDSIYYRETSEMPIGLDGTVHVSAPTQEGSVAGAPYMYSLQARVTDSGNQMIAARDSAIVHPASFYIGLSSPQGVKGFAKKGDKLSFGFLLATPEGETPVTAVLPSDKKISWTLSRKEWKEVFDVDEYGYESSYWHEDIVIEQSGSVKLDEKSGVVSFTPKDGGRYLLTLKTKDSKGREVVTERSFFVSGSDSFRRGDSEKIELVADKDEYDVGDTAHILLSSTLPKGRYLVTVEREGLLSEKVLTLDSPSTVIDVPVLESYVPIVWVGISSYSVRNAAPPKDFATRDEAKPRAVYGSIGLNISTKSRRFDLTVKQDKKSYLPGAEAEITINASKNGMPVAGAELTLMAVDRGVLDLMGYHVGNPLEFFYNQNLFSNGVQESDSYRMLADPVTYGTYTLPPELAAEQDYFYSRSPLMKMAEKTLAVESVAEMAAAPDMLFEDSATEVVNKVADKKKSSNNSDSPKVRKDFRSTAVFLPNLVTDANGKVVTNFKLPDSLTEYIVTVVGVKEQSYAYSETSLKVANPISVRDVETRILRPGDEGEAGVVITNIGDTSESVTVELSVLSGLEKTDYVPLQGEIVKLAGQASVNGTSSKSVTVNAGDTKTLMFRVNAEKDGWVTLAFNIKSRAVNEIIYKRLEIEKPYIYETVTTIGQIDENKDQACEKIIFPSATEDGRSSLFLQLDSSRLGTLRSAVNYVFHYPYGCLEQRSSAILPLVAFGKYIDVFGLKNEVKDIKSVVNAEMADWAKLQKSDGGFPYWKDGTDSSLVVSLRIGEIVSLARERGFDVPKTLKTDKLASYIEKEIKKLKKEHVLSRYPEAYAYYVLARLDHGVSTKDIAAIIDDKDSGISELDFAALAALTLKNRDLAEKAAAKIKNMISLTARGASFQTGTAWSRWYFYNNNSERFALTLHLFTALNPADKYNTHLVWELLEQQKSGNGWWQSTASTSRVLIALDAYIRALNLEDTDFTAEALLSASPALAQTSLLTGSFNGVGAKPVDKTWRLAGNKNPNIKKGEAHYSENWEVLSAEIPLDKAVDLTFTKNGKGTLFYTSSLSYAVPADEQKARDEGLCVYVEITDAETGEKVSPEKLKSGKIYREKVHVTTTKERTFVAVRAPIPAGAEVMNAAFVTTASVQGENDQKADRWYWRPWAISHQDIYDAEVRCFWDRLPIGSQSFEFLFRAQRTGIYGTPATTAECMYEPEIFGRSNGYTCRVED